MNGKKEGSIEQEPLNWSSRKNSWISSFPQFEDFLENRLPLEISRSTIRDIFSSSNYSTLEKFITVMIWGYSDRGYGPYRVNRMLAAPEAEKVISTGYRICQDGMPIVAYQYLAENRIPILGPSFGTKFMCFSTPKQIGAPILDSFVGLWINEFAGRDFEPVKMKVDTWNLRVYENYWSWINEHSIIFGCTADDIELAIFRDAELKFSSNSRWNGK